MHYAAEPGIRGFRRDQSFAWPLVPMSDVVTLNYGKALTAASRVEGDVPVYGSNGITGWHNEPMAFGPTVVLGRKGQGPLGVEWCNGPLWVIDTAYYVTFKDSQLEPRFFYYFTDYVGLNHLKDGTSNPSLTRATFDLQQIVLPPLDEQRRIAAILGALDDKIELNRKMNRTLEEMAQTILANTVASSDPTDGELLAGWRRASLGELVDQYGGEVQTGPFGSQLHASDYVEYGIPSVMPRDIKLDRVSTESVARITEADAERLSKHRLAPGDIVYSRRGDVERRALATERERGWLCGTGCLRVRLQGGLHPQYLYWYLGHPGVRSWIVRHAQGATMPNLNTKILRALPLAIPPRNEHDELVAVLEPLFRKREANYDEMATLAALRDTLLPKLITGELRVPEAEDLLDSTTSSQEATA